MATNAAPEDCRMTRSVSYFLVDDVFATAEFYRDVLGFTFDEFFGVPPSFVMVQRDDVNIMFRQVRPPRTPVARPNRTVMDETFDAYVYVSNVDQLAAELRAKKADIVEGPVDRIYGMRELLVRDCNGYVIAFGQG
ncbi:VOC family protein [Paraburkholderia ferrariae]|uniref:VOC family protein n=1 Tax=Paraburkholderia ferrariae TaxID=386056 RepID=UPI000A00BEE0|nr:VOC family protein [Paraburkholderia ferrariae]